MTRRPTQADLDQQMDRAKEILIRAEAEIIALGVPPEEVPRAMMWFGMITAGEGMCTNHYLEVLTEMHGEINRLIAEATRQ